MGAGGYVEATPLPLTSWVFLRSTISCCRF